MWKKCLMLSLIFTCIYTIKTMAFSDTVTDVSTNPQYSWTENHEIYDLYSQYYNGTRWYWQLLYKNDSTSEALFQVTNNYFAGYSSIFYVKGNDCYSCQLYWLNSNYNNWFYTNGYVFFDTNNDGTINKLYMFGTGEQMNNSNICYWDADFSLHIDTNSNCFCQYYDIPNILDDYDSWQVHPNFSSYTENDYYYFDNLGSGQHSVTEFVSDFSPSKYTIIPLTGALIYSKDGAIARGFNEVIYEDCFTNNTAEYYSQVSYTIPFSDNNSNKILLWDSDNGMSGGGSSSNENIILHLEDSNLRQIFHFNFNLPKTKEDSVYYAFMNRYVRNSYNSVTGYFTVYELSTPPEYTGSFQKYMIYDEDGKYFTFVNGLVVKAYSGSCDSGGTFTFDTTDINVNSTIVNDFIACLGEYQMFHLENDGIFVKPSTNVLAVGYNSCQSLGRHLINNLTSGIISRIGLRPRSRIDCRFSKKITLLF